MQCPGADFEDHAGLFHEGDELRRGHEPEIGALPADQSLQADDASGLGIDLGLVVQDELLSLERAAELALQR